MEKVKNLPFSGFHRMCGNIFVPLMGGLLIATLALQYSRSSRDDLATLTVLSVAAAVLAIAVSYLKFRRALERIKGSICEENLATLTRTANTMVIFGYSACMTAMVFVANAAHR